MSTQGWVENLVCAQADGAALANTVTATSILPAQAKFAFPVGFWSVGRQLRVIAKGRISTTTGPPTITLDLRLGAVIIFNGAAVTTVASVTNKTWEFEALLTTRAVGAGGSATANVFGTGRLTSSAVVGSTGGAANTAILPDATPAVGTSFDPGVAASLDMFATWGTANAANTIQLHQFSVESMN